MKKIIIALGGILAIIAGINFFNTNSPTTKMENGKQKISIMLDWFVNPDHGNIVIAKQMGFFAEQGLDVDILEPADASNPPKFSALKKVDYALNYQNSLQMQASEGWANTRIATMIDTPLGSIMALEKSGIKSMKDLQGKKIGFSAPGFEEATIGVMLEHNGLSMQGVKLININFALSSSLISGSVDAISGAYRNFEKTELELKGYKPVVFLPEENGVPMFDEIVMVTHKDNAKSETTKKVVRALQKAVDYMKANPEKSWKAFMAYKPDMLDTPLNKQAWIDTVPLFAKNQAQLNKERYAEFERFLKKQNLISKPMPAMQEYAINPFK